MIVVCPVLPCPPDGGSRKRTMRLLEAAERAGLSPHLLTPDRGSAGGIEALRGRGWVVEVLEEPSGLASRARQHLRRLPSPPLPEVERRLRELVDIEPSLVHFEHTQSAACIEALHGVQTVVSLHNVDSQLMKSIASAQRRGSVAWLRAWNRWQAMRAVERRTLPRADVVFCVSERDAEDLAHLNDGILVAPNGVDDDFFSVPAAPPGDPVLLFFGQLDYPPNDHGIVRFLRESWPAVAQGHPGVRLRIAGGGASAELREVAASAAGVELVGFVDDLSAELAMCALTVVPLWAGGGTRLKVLESLAAARPVVGTELGVEGLGFESERHGRIANTPADLAAAIVDLLRDPEAAHSLGCAGRALAQAFRWPHALASAEEAYRRIGSAEHGLARPSAP